MDSKSANTVEEQISDEAIQQTEEVVEDTVAKKPVRKTAEKKVEEKPLTESDEIKVIALVPNVRYLDNYTRDYYKWNNVGHEEFMKFGELERMWRNTKGYFRNMWLKPDDPRVIKKFGLEKIYSNYDILMDAKNYTYENVDNICNIIESITENEMKQAVCSKIKNFVATGKMVDYRVIKKLESRLNIVISSSI